MKKLLTIIAIIATTGTALPAYAFHCPVDMKKIDAATAIASNLTSNQMTKVKELRKTGEAEHKAGKHQDSVNTFAEAMKLLGIE